MKSRGITLDTNSGLILFGQAVNTFNRFRAFLGVMFLGRHGLFTESSPPFQFWAGYRTISLPIISLIGPVLSGWRTHKRQK
jgi:hypothetical protein